MQLTNNIFRRLALSILLTQTFIWSSSASAERNPCNDDGSLKGWALKRGYSLDYCDSSDSDSSDSTSLPSYCRDDGTLKPWARRAGYSADSCQIAQNAAPEVSIVFPTNGSQHIFGDPVDLVATVTDTEDGTLSASWHSSRDGSIHSSSILSEGLHTLIASATDSGGLTSEKSIVIEVVIPETNTPPTLSIISPAAGSVIEYGDSVNLDASAHDEQDGDISSTVAWSSSRDQNISKNTLLSVGLHTLTASVSDSNGEIVYETVNVEVVEPDIVNTAPKLTILSPSSGLVVESGTIVNFSINAVDEQDGDLSGSVQLVSSIDASITNDSILSNGVHTVTASVTDSGGLSSQQSITIEVIEPVIENSPPTLAIIAPSTDTEIYAGDSIQLIANAIDAEDGDLRGAVTWYSSIDQALLETAFLSEGIHQITASVTDSSGETVHDSITVEVLTRPELPENITVELSWIPPLDRTDGTVLAIDEIGGYELTIIDDSNGSDSVIDIVGGSMTNYQLELARDRTYYFALSAYDNERRFSAPTEPVRFDTR